jgi:hypothetical protein
MDTHRKYNRYFEAKLKTFNVKSTDGKREWICFVFMIKNLRESLRKDKICKNISETGNAFYFNDELEKQLDGMLNYLQSL